MAVGSGILGWVLDAFDFFVVVFLFDTLASHFHVGKATIVYTLVFTLAMRPVGALLFVSPAALPNTTEWIGKRYEEEPVFAPESWRLGTETESVWSLLPAG